MYTACSESILFSTGSTVDQKFSAMLVTVI